MKIKLPVIVAAVLAMVISGCAGQGVMRGEARGDR